MRPEDRKRVEDLFQEALDLPPEDRERFLERTEPDDDVRHQVQTLLAHYEAGRDVFDPPSETPEPISSIGPFRILRTLGVGGMGTVYLAEQSDPIARRVALKVIKPGMDTAPVLARFQAERQVLAMLEHPDIAQIHEAGTTDDGRPWFAMEYVSGHSIVEWCDQNRLSPNARIQLFLRVCGAIQHAHQKGVIHRDIKPGNILVSGDPGQPNLKVIDFGIAKAISADPTKPGVTFDGQLVGTPEYMSPEQAASSDIDTRADVYALGLLLYQLLVGSLPFEPTSLREMGVEAMLRVIREEDPPLPSSRVSTVGESATTIAGNRSTKPRTLSRLLRGDLDWIVLRALEKERERRYGSPAALADDLTRYLKKEPITARPPSAWYRAGKFIRRNRVGVAVAATLVLSLVAVTVVSVVQSRRVAAERDRVEQEATVSREVADFMGNLFHEATFGRSTGEEPTLRDSIDLGVSKLGSDDTEGLPSKARLRVLRILGDAYTNVGRQFDALPLLEQSVELAGAELGEDHLETALARYNLASCQRHANDYLGALTNYELASATFERELGRDDPQSLRCRWMMVTLKARVKGSEPIAEYEELLADYRRVYGNDSAKTAMLRGEVANAYGNQFRVKEAIALGEEGLQMLEAKYGEGSAMTVMALSGLFKYYRQAERDDDAAAILRKLRTCVETSFGPDNAQMGTVHFKEGLMALDRDDLSSARSHFEKALATYRISRLRENLIWCLLHLADIARRESADLATCRAHLDEVETFLDQFADDSSTVGLHRRSTSELEASLGNHAEALALAESSIEIMSKNFPEGHPQIAMSRMTQARALAGAGRMDEAQTVVDGVRSDFVRALGEDSRAVRRIDARWAAIEREPRNR